ncbi:MAG: S8 family serine peptidase [Vicinamibacterales bacterium]
MPRPSGWLRQLLISAAGLAIGLGSGLAVVRLQAAPSLLLASPSSGAVVSGQVRLYAWTDQPGLRDIQFLVSASPVGPLITSGDCVASWNTTAVKDGTYTVSALAHDATGTPVFSQAVSVRVDNLGPGLQLEVTDITDTEATIRWVTGVPADGRVEFGLSKAYGDGTRTYPDLVTTHAVTIAGLAPSTAYHYRIHSRASDGQVFTSEDEIFITEAPPGPEIELLSRTRGRTDPAGTIARPSADLPRVVRTDPAAPAVLGRQLTTARAQAFIEADARGLDYVPGEVLVRFKPGMTPADQQRALLALRSRPSVGDLDWHGEVAVLRDESQPDARILAAQLGGQPEVDYAEPNYLMRVRPRRARPPKPLASGPVGLTPNDTDFGDQWNLTAIDAPGAWDIQPGGRSDLIVAVVDTGVTTVNASFNLPLWTGTAIETRSIPFAMNPDLSAGRLVGGRDFVFSEVNGPVLDMDGHGTHVASTIAEDTNNAFALAGVAYNVRVMPVKVCLTYWDIQFTMSAAGITGFTPPTAGGCPINAIADGVRYAADSGAKVINLSLGGPGQSLTLRAAIQYAVQRGAFVAIASGNEFTSGNASSYPAADAASIDGAMAVTAVGRSLNHAGYANTGNYNEIAAPGGDFDDGGINGLIWQVTLNPLVIDPFDVVFPVFNVYAEVAYEGTSSAAPHVAGAAALLASQGITDPATIEAILAATARDLGAPGRDDTFGAGLLQARAALFGFGIRK